MRDPLANPKPLIRRIYAYAAYRLGDGPDAEDATSDAFERALRYRSSFDPRKGTPAAWMIGIARRSVDEILAARTPLLAEPPEEPTYDRDSAVRIDLTRALDRLDERDRELVALRYGADLTAKQIAAQLDSDVTQSTINSTICVSGWTATVRPPTSYTNPLKAQGIIDYGYSDTSLSSYEEDHQIPLELGGSPRDPKNLWPEPYSGSETAHSKDGVETKLKNAVCDGRITLSAARTAIKNDWTTALSVTGIG